MDATAVLVALIGGVPATIAALAAWRSAARSGRKVASIDRQVNGQPADAPTLVQKLDQLGADVRDVKTHLGRVDGRLLALERTVG